MAEGDGESNSPKIRIFLCPRNRSHDPLYLPPNTKVYIGRDPIVKIKDISVSRKHLSFVANYDTDEVTIKHEGQLSSVVNGNVIEKHQIMVVSIKKSLTTIEVRPGDHIYDLQLEMPELKANPEGSHFWKNGIVIPEDFDMMVTPPKRLKLSDSESNECLIPVGWSHHSTLKVYRTPDCEDRSLIAAFDLDGTLIKTQSGNVFPIHKTDWLLWSDEVKPKLRVLHDKGYKIVVLTNQAGISTGKTNLSDFQEKVESIAQQIGVPMLVLIASASDVYRKPSPGMWAYMAKMSSVPIFYDGCVMVGDAAGRQANWVVGKKKDFSLADRLFAMNIGIPFHTPEEFFQDMAPVPFVLPAFNPGVFDAEDFVVEPTKHNREVVFLIGLPASGKTTFYNKHFRPTDYVHINRDTQKTNTACLKILEEVLKSNKSGVIDNLNLDEKSRKPFTDMCRKFGAPMRCFILSSSLQRCFHNNAIRTYTDVTHSKVPPMVITKSRKTLQRPTPEEGFEEIIDVPFVPYFSSEKEKYIYSLYYVLP